MVNASGRIIGECLVNEIVRETFRIADLWAGLMHER